MFANLVEMYEESCERFAQRNALAEKKNGEWIWSSYVHVRRLIDECRGGLATLGVGKGDRVAFIANNRLEWAVAAFATYGLEAIFVPMYEEQVASDRRHILKDSGACVVFAGTDEIDRETRAMAAELPNMRRVIGLERAPSDPDSFRHLLGIGEDNPFSARSPHPDSIAGLIYTSGTTGLPKGVMLSHGNIVSNLTAVREVFPVRPDDRTLAFLPWAHAYGQVCELYYGLSQGCACAINDDITRLLDNLAEVRPTLLLAVPRIFNRLYTNVVEEIAKKSAPIQKMFAYGLHAAAKHRQGERDRLLNELSLKLDDRLIFSKVREKLGGNVRLVICGAASLSPDVAELIDAVGIPVYEGYGLTETSPVVSTNTPQARRIGSVGRVLPGVRVVIDESRGGAPGEGEIIVYGPLVMKGYYGHPEKTAEVLTEDGGLRTGDLGRFDKDGFLFVVGRIKEQYKLENGKYVQPAMVEEALELSPFIATSMVYGDNKPYNVALLAPSRPNLEEWARKRGIELGDITRNPDVRTLLESEARRHAADLPAFVRPRDFVIVDEVFTPENGLLTPTLKLRRKGVTERWRDRLEALYRAPVSPTASAPR